jgi:hypothetical protein
MSELGAARRRELREALRLAQPDTGDLLAQDEKLGVSVSRPKVGT